MNNSAVMDAVTCCQICGSDQIRVAYEMNKFDLLKCSKCGHLFSFVKEKQEDYKGHYFFGDKKEYFEHPDERLYSKLHRLIQKYHSAQKKIYRLLDVGTGVGALPKHFDQLGYDGYGIDISEEAIRYGKEELKTPNLTATPIESYYPDTKFDVVICNNVIEHVPDPVNLAKNIYRLLSDDGLFLCVTVDSKSPIFYLSEKLFQLSKGTFRGPLERVCDVHHLHHFNQSSLEYVLKVSGFETRSRFGWDLPLESILLTPLQKIAVSAAYGVSAVINSHFLQGVVCVKRSS